MYTQTSILEATGKNHSPGLMLMWPCRICFLTASDFWSCFSESQLHPAGPQALVNPDCQHPPACQSAPFSISVEISPLAASGLFLALHCAVLHVSCPTGSGKACPNPAWLSSPSHPQSQMVPHGCQKGRTFRRRKEVQRDSMKFSYLLLCSLSLPTFLPFMSPLQLLG